MTDEDLAELIEGADAETLAAVAGHLWSVVTELDDADSELTATAVTRRRIEGAALTLDVLAGRRSGV